MAGRPHVIIAGVSARALAESAARAGYRVTAVDAYGDLDLAAIADVVTVPSTPRFDPATAARAVAQVHADAATYVSSFENDARAVAALARHRTLLGNPPTTLARARDPFLISRALRRHGLPAPRVRATKPASGAAQTKWLRKPRASGGGHGIAPWVASMALPRRAILQERIDGIPGSIVFAADGRNIVPLAITRQLVGERRLGARGFKYCGNVLVPVGDRQFPGDGALADRACALAAVLTRELRLRGLNGIDFIARSGTPWPVEVNPRPTAAMELVERAHGVSVFEMHAQACAGSLPAVDIDAIRRQTDAVGKAIVYARQSVTVSDTRAWCADDSVRDIPRPGTWIERGHPICTIFARARTVSTCRAALVHRAMALYSEVEHRAWRRG